jgi:hypothetical protein
MVNTKVIYTSIFGEYDILPEPTFIPEGWDFICFTDSDITSEVWTIKKVPAIYEDSTRNARKYKILPHRWFPDYEYSLWIDGNIVVRDNVNQLITDYLQNANLAVHDHNQNLLDPRECVYKEAETIFYFGQKNGNYKDDPQLISDQMNRYIADEYPANMSLAVTMQLLRRHNEVDCIKAMEHWWQELKYGSKRDQLSFNYTVWKTQMVFNYFTGDSRDNKYFLNTGKHKKKPSNIHIEYTSTPEFSPINIEYFLNMELANGGGGKEIIKQNGKLVTVRDIIDYFSDKDRRAKIEATLTPSTWQYYNCMMAEFRHSVGNHHDIGWENMTKQYYESLELMTDEEIEIFLTNTPVEFDNGFIRHNYHRACAMIGRLIAGKPYIPFYMKTSQIYSTPRIQDGKHRVKPLIDNVYGIEQIKLLGIPESEYTITQSGILALMGIRKNDDIDIIISSRVRRELFNNNTQFIKLPGNIEIFEPNRRKFLDVDGVNDDDLIANHSIIVNGIRFLHPKFYFSRKRIDRDKDKKDWEGIVNFFKLEKFKGFPYNSINLEQWGQKWVLEYMQ